MNAPVARYAAQQGFFYWSDGWLVALNFLRTVAFLERIDMLGTKTRERIELSITAAWISFLAIVLIVLIGSLG